MNIASHLHKIDIFWWDAINLKVKYVPIKDNFLPREINQKGK